MNWFISKKYIITITALCILSYHESNAGNIKYYDINGNMISASEYSNILNNNKDKQMYKNVLSRHEPKALIIPGKYPETSTKILTVSELKKYNHSELVLMRNEIFARYYYIFKSPSLNSYFKKQKWYIPRFRNVASRLTKMEKINIALIKKMEIQKK